MSVVVAVCCLQLNIELSTLMEHEVYQIFYAILVKTWLFLINSFYNFCTFSRCIRIHKELSTCLPPALSMNPAAPWLDWLISSTLSCPWLSLSTLQLPFPSGLSQLWPSVVYMTFLSFSSSLTFCRLSFLEYAFPTFILYALSITFFVLWQDIQYLVLN